MYSGMTNVAPEYGALVSVTGDVAIASAGCWLYPVSHPTNGGSVLFRMRSLTIATNAGISADTLGFSAGYVAGQNGFGPGGSAGGGSYGGRGGNGISTYGSVSAPTAPVVAGIPATHGTGAATAAG